MPGSHRRLAGRASAGGTAQGWVAKRLPSPTRLSRSRMRVSSANWRGCRHPAPVPRRPTRDRVPPRARCHRMPGMAHRVRSLPRAPPRAGCSPGVASPGVASPGVGSPAAGSPAAGSPAVGWPAVGSRVAESRAWARRLALADWRTCAGPAPTPRGSDRGRTYTPRAPWAVAPGHQSRTGGRANRRSPPGRWCRAGPRSSPETRRGCPGRSRTGRASQLRGGPRIAMRRRRPPGCEGPNAQNPAQTIVWFFACASPAPSPALTGLSPAASGAAAIESNRYRNLTISGGRGPRSLLLGGSPPGPGRHALWSPLPAEEAPIPLNAGPAGPLVGRARGGGCRSRWLGCHGACELDDEGVELLVRRVEMRRNTDAGARAIVDDDIAGSECGGDRVARRDVEGHRAAAVGHVARPRDPDPGRVSERYQILRLAHRLGSNCRHPDLVHDLVAGPRRVERRHIWSPVQEPVCILGVVDRTVLEGERLPVRHPTREAWLQGAPVLAAHVEVAGTRTAAQPFDRAPGREVGTERADIDGDRTGGLVQVHEDERAHVVRPADHRRDVLDERTLEDHMRHGHQPCRLVDRRQQPIEGHGQAVVRGDRDESRALALDGVKQIEVRREVQTLSDDAVARPAPIHRGQHGRLRYALVLVHHHFAGSSADDAADQVTDRAWQLPPSFAPRADAASGPRIRVFVEAVARAPRHRAERMAYEVDGIGEDRELAAPMQEVVSGHASIVSYWLVAASEDVTDGPHQALHEELARMLLRLRKLARTPLLATGRHAPYVT